jgi:hypothetical protein
MNILLWVLQVLLGLYFLMGGSWMLKNIPGPWLKIMPKPVWMALGLLQVLFALGLILPGALKMSPQLTPISAVGVAVEILLITALTKPKFQGALWAVIPALLSLFVAYGRFVLSPF